MESDGGDVAGAQGRWGKTTEEQMEEVQFRWKQMGSGKWGTEGTTLERTLGVPTSPQVPLLGPPPLVHKHKLSHHQAPLGATPHQWSSARGPWARTPASGAWCILCKQGWWDPAMQDRAPRRAAGCGQGNSYRRGSTIGHRSTVHSGCPKRRCGDQTDWAQGAKTDKKDREQMVMACRKWAMAGGTLRGQDGGGRETGWGS